jgi:hypothetical protein
MERQWPADEIEPMARSRIAAGVHVQPTGGGKFDGLLAYPEARHHVGFEGLSGNRMLDQSITGFDPERSLGRGRWRPVPKAHSHPLPGTTRVS